MKHSHNLRSYLLGVLTTLMILGLATPALAAAAQKTIEVSTGVRIFIDDVELHPTDANGKPVDVFIYNGTTYLPVRAIGEGFGKTVQWDGSTQSVYIGKHSSDTPVAWLAQLDYFTQLYSWKFDRMTKDNLGNEHTHSLEPSSVSKNNISYKLNGQYSRLTGLYYQKYENRAELPGSTNTVIISGDGVELWRGAVGSGIDPLSIDIDITNVLELAIEYPQGAGRANSTAFGDVALWS